MHENSIELAPGITGAFSMEESLWNLHFELARRWKSNFATFFGGSKLFPNRLADQPVHDSWVITHELKSDHSRNWYLLHRFTIVLFLAHFSLSDPMKSSKELNGIATELTAAYPSTIVFIYFLDFRLQFVLF